jgi:transporter family-2 protein
MQLVLILLVIAGGMGLSVEAGLLGPWGESRFMGDVQHFWRRRRADVSADAVFQPAQQPVVFRTARLAAPRRGAGPIYVVILTLATPTIGIALTMIGILAGQVFKSLIIDHFGLLGTPHRKINARRIVALVFIIAALVLVARG